jgi:hypothetical protein
MNKCSSITSKTDSNARALQWLLSSSGAATPSMIPTCYRPGFYQVDAVAGSQSLSLNVRSPSLFAKVLAVRYAACLLPVCPYLSGCICNMHSSKPEAASRHAAVSYNSIASSTSCNCAAQHSAAKSACFCQCATIPDSLGTCFYYRPMLHSYGPCNSAMKHAVAVAAAVAVSASRGEHYVLL